MASSYFGYELTDAKIQTAGVAKAVTFTDAGDLVTASAHGYSNGDSVAFTVIATTTGIAINTLYYVIAATTNTFQVALTAGGSAIALATDGTGTVRRMVETNVLFANKITIDVQETTLTFEGDAQTKNVYFLSGMTASLSPDCITVEAAEEIFGKTAVSSGLPTGLTRLTWYGEATERGGVTAGMWAEGYAIKSTAGVESVVGIRLWLPMGTLTLSGPPSLTTKEKAGQQTYKLGATLATTTVIGTALPTVPTGGAYYAIAER